MNARFIDLTSGEVLFNLPVGLFWGAIVPSKDGKFLATGNPEVHGVRVYDLKALLENATEQPLFSLGGHESDVFSIASSSNGKLLATGSFDTTIKIWAINSEGGQELMSLRGHESIILDVSFSPDNHSVATASGDGKIKVWDITPEGSKELLTRVSHKDRVWAITYSPDGTLYATASFDGTAKIWKAESGKLLQTLSGHEGMVYGVSFHPDGNQLATSGEDNTVRIWDVNSGQELQTLTDHEEAANDYDIATLLPGVLVVAYSPDGKLLASVGEDGTARIWDAKSGELLKSLLIHPKRHGGTILAFSPDGSRLATATDLHGPGPELDAILKVWEVETGQEMISIDLPNRGSALAFSPDGTQLVASGAEGFVIAWDPTTGQKPFTLSGTTDEINDVTISPNGSRLVTNSPEGVKVWDSKSRRELFTLTGHIGIVTSADFNTTGSRLVTAGGDGTVRIYTMDIDELIAVAEARLTRWFTQEECQQFLHSETCPLAP